jgi:hypothetical protein
MTKILAQGARDVDRQGQLTAGTGFSGRDSERLKPPINVGTVRSSGVRAAEQCKTKTCVEDTGTCSLPHFGGN